MSIRKEISLRHGKHDQYKLVAQEATGMCVIEDATGRRARVKAEWLDIDGSVCWAGGFRKALHIKNAVWGKGEGQA